MAGDMAAIKAAKSELRSAVRQRLKQLTNDEIKSRSQKVHQSLFTMPEYQKARNISIYLSMPTGEISTSAIVEDSLRKGKTVFVPYLHKTSIEGSSNTISIMDMVSLRSEADYNSLQLDKWGIPTPDKASIADRLRVLGERDYVETNEYGVVNNVTLDLIIVPGVAFDRESRRLGHGKGFYDFFLHRYHERCVNVSHKGASERPTMPYLGLALREQLLPPGQVVPTTSADWQLDGLLVDDESFHRRSQ